MISYYDLLTLWKYNQHPKKVKLTTKDGTGIFEWSEEYHTYYATNPEELLHEYGMDSYMFDNIYDSFAFDKCIEIIDDSTNDIKLMSNDSNGIDDCISYFDLLTLISQGIIPKLVLVNSNGYLAHYLYDEENNYSIVYDDLYNEDDCNLHWDAFLNHELSYCVFEKCIKIEK